MNVKELKEILSQYDDNMTVRVFDSNSGNIDITEVYEPDLAGAHYICII